MFYIDNRLKNCAQIYRKFLKEYKPDKDYGSPEGVAIIPTKDKETICEIKQRLSEDKLDEAINIAKKNHICNRQGVLDSAEQIKEYIDASFVLQYAMLREIRKRDSRNSDIYKSLDNLHSGVGFIVAIITILSITQAMLITLLLDKL